MILLLLSVLLKASTIIAPSAIGITATGSGTYTWIVLRAESEIFYTGTCFVAGLRGIAVGDLATTFDAGSIAILNGELVPVTQTVVLLNITPTLIKSLMPKIWCKDMTFSAFSISTTTLEPTVTTLSGTITTTITETKTYLTPIITTVTSNGLQIPTVTYSTVTYTIPKVTTTVISYSVTTTTPTVTLSSLITNGTINYAMIPVNPVNVVITELNTTFVDAENLVRLPVTVTVAEVKPTYVTNGTVEIARRLPVQLLALFLAFLRRSKSFMS